MKIEITMQLELPPSECDNFSDAEMRQMLFDSIQNRLTVGYLQAACHAFVDKNFSSEEQRTATLYVYNTWADIMKSATWDWKKVD
jgi:hypothetical protein